jgi:hypothetical protein
MLPHPSIRVRPLDGCVLNNTDLEAAFTNFGLAFKKVPSTTWGNGLIMLLASLYHTPK